jgi:hypothetical protein
MSHILPFDERRVDLFRYAQEPSGAIGLTTEYLVTTLLAMNVGNRHVRKSHVQFLVDTIHRGNWTLVPNGIGVTRTGLLIDGQHRLMAIAEAGYPALPVLVMFGLDPAVAAAIDLGLRRSIADLMHFAFGHPEMTGQMIAVTRSWAENTGLTKPGLRHHADDVASWYMTIQPALENVFAIAGASRRLPAPTLAAIIHRLHRVPDDRRPLTFLEGLLSGANLGENSPVLRLIKYLNDTRPASGQTQAQDRFQRTASALIAFLEERPLSKLYTRDDALELLASTPSSVSKVAV